jgi:hypothetical protein
MAQWKKVIVQGGNVSDLNNDANYVSVNAIPAFVTASFGGTPIYASGSETTQVFSVVSGSVASDPTVQSGLSISVSASTATFTLTQIPTASLAHTGSYIGKTKVGLGEVVTSISGANFVDITATGSFTGSFIGDGSGLTNLTATRLATGSITASVDANGDVFEVRDTALGDIFRVTDKTSAVLGRPTIPNTVDASGSFVLGDGGNVIGQAPYVVTPDGIDGRNSLVGGERNRVYGESALVWGKDNTVGTGSNNSILLGTNLSASNHSPANPNVPKVIIGRNNVDRPFADDLFVIGNGANENSRSNLAVFGTASINFNAPVTGSSFTGSFVGDGSGLTGVASTLVLSGSNPAYGLLTGSVDLKTQFLQVTGSGNEVEVTLITSSNGATFQVGLPNNVAISQSLEIGRNLTVEGDFLVKGTASFISTQDLFVADRFIVLASGSTGATDSGIIIDRGSYVSSSVAYGYDADLDRWGWQSNIADTSSAMSLQGGGGNAAFAAYLFTEVNHGPKENLAGEFTKVGSFWAASGSGDLYIYA